MSKSQNGPRKPATKFPHLRKQMQQNALNKMQTTRFQSQSLKRPNQRKP